MSAAPADRLEVLFHAALEMPAAERRAFVERSCGDDAGLRGELEALLEADSRGDLPLDQPALVDRVLDRLRAHNRALPAGRCIGSYELVRLIGSGGMGSVYEAIQKHPRRTVALKLLRASFATPAELRRFQYEVELLGRLQHANIAQIYEGGVHEDGVVSVPFFAMECIADASHLLDFVRAGSASLRERLDLFLKICDAVQHGHQRGVVHRDLKPSNILVDAAGEPRVIDYGVARALDAEMHTTTLRSSPAEFVGTLQYMAPEQLRADPAAVDTRCDIYALGLVLFELLTERRPFDLSRLTWTQAIRTIESAPAPSAAAFRPELRGDLATIIAKACEKDRDARYQSVGELAADIRRHLNDEPISARAPSLIYHARKFAARHRAFVAAVSVSMASLIAGTAVALWYAAAANAERIRTEQNARRVELVRGFLENMIAATEPQNLGARVSMLDAINRSADALPVTLESDPQVFGDLQSIIGRAYVRMGENERAISHLKAAIEARRITCGDPSDPLALSLVDLAWVGCPQTHDDQIRLLRQATEMYAALRGPNAPIIAALQSYTAWFIDVRGDSAEAEALVRDALARLERVGLTNGDKYAYAQRVLGDILFNAKRFAEAEQAMRTALAIQRNFTGRGKMELATTLRRLARLLEETGRKAEAEPLRAEAAVIEPHRL